ncbi:MAG: F0F1 ATP synthase subunit epsilon [Planctomycetaceae bacterium]|nr:F0F1 ATP synthase subunit epsilon [Planctomycetaceae bacterium]
MSDLNELKIEHPERLKPFHCELLVPDAKICDVEAVYAVFPLADGLIGILHGHAPMIGRIGGGPMTLTGPNGRLCQFYVAGGFVQVTRDRVMLLAEECIPADKLDREKVWEELEAVIKRPVSTAQEGRDRLEAMATLRLKFSMAQQVAGKR